MKIMKTDFSLKYIIFKSEDKEYIVQFRYSFFKGVYDVEIWTSTNRKGRMGKEVIVEATYPNFKQRIVEAWILLRSSFFKKYQRQHSR